MKTRRSFFGALAGLISAAAFGQKSKSRKKFYVTGLFHTDELNDCTLPPMIAFGTDRLDALAHSGLTVWTEEEYLEMRRDSGEQVDKICAEMKQRREREGD